MTYLSEVRTVKHLTKQIEKVDGEADRLKWERAEMLTALCEAATQQRVADDTGLGRQVVSNAVRIWRKYADVARATRPRYTDADYEAAGRGPGFGSAPPKTTAEAEKLVQNIVAKAPLEVQDTVYHELRLARAGEDRSMSNRKAAQAAASHAAAPIRRAIASSGPALCAQALEEAYGSLTDAMEADALSSDAFALIDEAFNRFALLLAEARFSMEATI